MASTAHERETMAERLVVIGGDAAGMSAASQARDRRGPDDLRIVAFEKGAHASYSACGIPYLVGGAVTDVESLADRRPEVFRDKLGIDLRLRSEVVEIDLDRRAVAVRDEGGDLGGESTPWPSPSGTR
ncbi:FAD-dependent oxidoreductase [Streptosporangium sp. NPDC002607]